ncbi:MAG TPA: hypothetical protein VK509_07550 [Polyangiales bacterium]|nr:hypothetical protein [Polyangiales bacterium]
MNAPLQVVRLAVHEDKEPSEESEVDLSSTDAALLLEQVKALRSAVEALSAKVNDALHHAQAATVELHGVGGNPGLSQQVFALRERTDGAVRALERELEASRNHAAQMFKLALDQQSQQADSLRSAIHGVETSLHQVRDSLDARARDIDMETTVKVEASARDMIDRIDDVDRSFTGRLEAHEKSTTSRFTDFNGVVSGAQENTKQRNRWILIACVAVTAWSLFGIWSVLWNAIKGPG